MDETETIIYAYSSREIEKKWRRRNTCSYVLMHWWFIYIEVIISVSLMVLHRAGKLFIELPVLWFTSFDILKMCDKIKSEPSSSSSTFTAAFLSLFISPTLTFFLLKVLLLCGTWFSLCFPLSYSTESTVIILLVVIVESSWRFLHFDLFVKLSEWIRWTFPFDQGHTCP